MTLATAIFATVGKDRLKLCAWLPLLKAESDGQRHQSSGSEYRHPASTWLESVNQRGRRSCGKADRTVPVELGR